jgi:hypothetical protein
VTNPHRSVTESPLTPDALSVTAGWAPDGRTCERCGIPLAHTYGWGTVRYRLGARHCSNACRQATYRQRKAGAS